MDFSFDITLNNRKILAHYLDKLSLETLNKVPEGFNNNIFWNIAHVVVTQQLLVYGLSNIPMSVSEEMVATYRKGTKAEKDASQAEVDAVKKLLFSTIEKTKEDLAKGVFKEYKEYTVSTGSTLQSVKDGIDFNNFHEGIHLGYIMAIRKAIGA